jgi:hypothetical protein
MHPSGLGVQHLHIFQAKEKKKRGRRRMRRKRALYFLEDH